VLPVGEKKIVVVIREEDLAQAIGRDGQNIRLASKMLDKEIDVFGDEEFTNMTEEQRAAALNEAAAPAEVPAAGEAGPAAAEATRDSEPAGGDAAPVVATEEPPAEPPAA
jgi:N utilization substance protein A